MEYVVNYRGSLADLIVEAESPKDAWLLATGKALSIIEGSSEDDWTIEEAPAE